VLFRTMNLHCGANADGCPAKLLSSQPQLTTRESVTDRRCDQITCCQNRTRGEGPGSALHPVARVRHAFGHAVEGFGFDLADAFAGEAEGFADFFEGARLVVFEAETHS